MRALKERKLTHDRLLEVLKYDPDTGDFLSMVARGSRTDIEGTVAGQCHNQGYVAVTIDYKQYLAHRLAWFYVHGTWPEHEIDHINRDRSDNRIENLRESSRSQNMANTGLYSNNKSGFRGVHFSRHAKRFCAQLRCGDKRYNLGYFDTAEAAHKAYRSAAQKHFGEFAQSA